MPISRSKGNQTMKFSQLIEYNVRNIFLLKSCKKWVSTLPTTLIYKQLESDFKCSVFHRFFSISIDILYTFSQMSKQFLWNSQPSYLHKHKGFIENSWTFWIFFFNTWNFILLLTEDNSALKLLNKSRCEG